MSMFPSKVVKWYQLHQRDLPWRETKDPYVIWLSEIILQQTRVSQGLPYFEKFVEKFPTVFDLAKASEEEVLRLWQGLGYYSRGRNLHETARYIVRELSAEFPSDYKGLLALKGVGDYTAAAIASFAYEEAVPVVDGNVFRVLSRYFGITTPIDSTEGKKEFKALAKDLIEGQQPSLFNQAIMEFGALQCVPKGVDCSVCPLMESCSAKRKSLVDELPIKAKKIKRTKKYFVYLVDRNEDKVVLEQRKHRGIWAKMYTFPHVEISSELDAWQQVVQKIENGFSVLDFKKKELLFRKHVLTHQDIFYSFIPVRFGALPLETKWYSLADVDRLPLPKLMENYFNNL